MRSRLVVLSMLFSVAALAGAMTVKVWVFGTGVATEADRSSAMSEALDSATQQANAMCTGVVTTTEPTGNFCINSTDGDGNTQYSCTAMVKALCEIQGRGR